MSGALRFALGQRATWVWGLLVAATCLSWWLGTGTAGQGGADTRGVSTVLVAVAFVKVRFVIRDFMEVRSAGWLLRTVTDLWCLAVAGVVLALYWQVV